MAVTRSSRHIVLAAAADAVVGVLYCSSLQFQITGGTIGQQWVVTNTNGDVIAQGYVSAATEVVECLVDRETFNGIIWLTKPAAGTSLIYVRLY